MCNFNFVIQLKFVFLWLILAGLATPETLAQTKSAEINTSTSVNNEELKSFSNNDAENLLQQINNYALEPVTNFDLEPLPELAKLDPEQNYASISELTESQITSATSSPESNYPLVSELEQAPKLQQPKTDPNYIIPPHVVEDKKINPFTTTLPLNGTPISHLTEREAVGGYEFGEDRSDNFIFDGIVKISSQVEESLTKNNIFTVDQKGSYFQLRTVRSSREVTVTRKEPQTLVGFQMQLSFTGACVFEGTNADDQCTYTPGLITDRSSIDPNFLVPTRIIQTASVGDVVTPESLAVIRLPGFQSGANGQRIGLDLYFPNTGGLPGNTQTDETSIDRREEIEYTIAGAFSRVRQIVRVNDKEAVIGRTVHGWVGVLEDDNTILSSALGILGQLLPDIKPHIDGSTNPPNPNVNKNLFLAPNNTRIPDNSFTIYHAGIGRASSPKPSTDLNQIPPANFNSLWLGISPVIDRSFYSNIGYEVTGLPRILANAGAEGGINANISLLSLVNGQNFFTGDFEDFYAQIYLTFFNTDANLVTTETYKEKTTYYPHVSFTGNITNAKDVFRYYTGVIAVNPVKAYLGLDYTRNTLNGWTYNLGGIGYINPDRDYYSQLFGSLAKIIRLGQTSNLVLSTGFNWAIDQELSIGDDVLISPVSTVTLSAKANFDPFSVGVVGYLGDILPNSIENTLLLSLEFKPSERFKISGYFTPINENASRSRYGASLQYKFGSSYNSPTLAVVWSNNEYDFGNDPVGRELSTNNNVFTVLFRVGEPPKPFDLETAERLRQQTQQEENRYRRQQLQEQLQQQKPELPVAPQ